MASKAAQVVRAHVKEFLNQNSVNIPSFSKEKLKNNIEAQIKR
jgi:hypothetical protein